MSDTDRNADANFVGSTGDDQIVDGYQGDDGSTLSEQLDNADRVNGNAGSDDISTGAGNDLAAGDMVGAEWTYVNGEWVYDAAAVVVTDLSSTPAYDDVICTGAGNDVLLGNRGNDTLFGGAGNDRLNAGSDDDRAFGEDGNDTLNLGSGDDYGEGGMGADLINGGAGDDVIYGDLNDSNLLSNTDRSATSFADYGDASGWQFTDIDGQSQISQSAGTVAGESYTIAFELAANLSAGYSTGAVEVLWNGEVVDTIETTSGAYQRYEVDVVSAGSQGELSFRAVEPEVNDLYDFSGPIASYEKTVEVGGQEVPVDAFAPGQSTLYQVIGGQLKAFDVDSQQYVDVGSGAGFKVNAVGFNVEDDLIYGVAKSAGFDSLGNPVSNSDIVMIDASGASFRVGDGVYADYVGDFDASGNLWTFHSSLDRISVVDIDNLDADGNPVIDHYNLPNGLFTDRTYDLAFNAQDGHFYAVVSPGRNGEAGKVVQIDVATVQNGGQPTFKEVPITGTLYGDTMESGMAKGAYGAVFMDGDGTLYYGLNRGDHDLDASTGAQGGIFRVNVNWDTDQAYSEFMAEAESTSSNDGTMDPRAVDTFADIDADAAVLLRSPELTPSEGGDDRLRGGSGDDEMHGGFGDDRMHGGQGEDTLFGDEGSDRMFGNHGNDVMSGGDGDDKMLGQAGDDTMSGDAGRDYMHGGGGNDVISGGDGVDKLVGGAGRDVIEGGAGNDHMWGGHWRGDNSADTFVVSGGSGQDIIHDFETDHDQIDLSAYGIDYDDLKTVMSDKGWATEINLAALGGGDAGDRLFLKSVEAEDLDESNFIL
ncbi:calcium-binding protein [Shimia ponticola]|uniref:calcium-binding protein n=1 Tax=Shimia ponticola TaxID=2582893 RepID=UPI0011BE08D9|nr:calcium-binding protein [Shimia ponticola]